MPRQQPFTALCRAIARPSNSGRADLHTHTTCSDGTYSPAQVVELARRSGLSAVAITDHDTTAGYEPAVAAAGSVQVVPGIELTARHTGAIVHILGYFFRPDDERLSAALRRQSAERSGRFLEMADRLKALGVALPAEQVRAGAEVAAPGRRHLAQLVVNAGRAETVRQAFYRYLGDGGAAFVPAPALPADKAIALLRSAGGVAAWAHPPYDEGTRRTLIELQALGLAAVEVDFPGLPSRKQKALRALAAELGMAVTGGSDCHGPEPARRAVGSGGVTADELQVLRNLSSSPLPRSGGEGGKQCESTEIIAMVLGAIWNKIKQGLSKTRSLFGGVAELFRFKGRVDKSFLDKLEERLYLADVGNAATSEIVERVRQAFLDKEITGDVEAFVKQQLKDQLSSASTGLEYAAGGPTVVMIAGVNGSGKTTSIAKLAKRCQDEGKKVLVAACDTFRAAAVEQLTIWSTRLGIDIVKNQQGSDPAAVAHDACERTKARDYDVLIVDTAGRLHTQAHLMRELEKIHRIVSKQIPGAPHEVLLVLDATSGQNAIAQAEMFKKTVKCTGIILAKLDGTAKGGAIFGIKRRLDLPVKFIGIGEKVEDLETFDPDAYVEALFSE